MTSDEQLDEWVKGNPVHNKGRDECCPDFSCCQPKLLASEAVRRKFRDADEKARMGFLWMFLGAVIALESDKKVYVSGDGTMSD